MRTVLFVGAGRHQRRAIAQAKGMKLRVAAVDRNPDAPGLAEADIAKIVDFADVDAVLRATSRLRIDGVLTVSADRAVPVVAAVAAARRVHAAGAPVAGIDGGVLALARAGLLDHCRHTGNHAGHIDMHVPDYRGAEQYDATVLAVSDGGTLTASELGSVEFAREVIRTLDLYNASDREHWFRLYKHALPPPWLAGATAAAA